MMVVPSLSLVRLSPSNQVAHRESRCPWTRIAYHRGPSWSRADVGVMMLLLLSRVAADEVSFGLSEK
jgi:hypothetical protein